MNVKQASIADRRVWVDVRERWERGETALRIVDEYMGEKEGSIFQINKILSRSATRYREPGWIAEAEKIDISAARKGKGTRAIIKLLKDNVGRPHAAYLFTEKDVEFLRRMAGLIVDPEKERYHESRYFCGVLHRELKRVKKEADADSLFLDKEFPSKCVEKLDVCHDAPILGEIKKKVEVKKRKKQKANTAGRKRRKKTDSV